MAEQHYTVKKVDWKSAEAEEARRIRFEVFVDEQKVPAELELDTTDSIAQHVIAYDADHRPCGTARLFSISDEPGCAHIGRMAVVADARGAGCGSALMRTLIEEARTRGFGRITLSAQTHAAPFYARHGFQAEGEIYDDTGIPHQRMELELTQ